ncbi:hypothetical protein IRB23M11_23970 [Alkalibacterium sp. m-11]|uniref:Uncharacterized protein n=1 Tax=Alkalibacterium indicireducens TaxID=398758 RepID=A0ABN1ADS7_9LACT
MDKYLFEATVHNTDGVEGTAFVEGEGGLSVTTSHPLDDSSGTNPEELFGRAPGMGDNLVVKVHYRLGSRNC